MSISWSLDLRFYAAASQDLGAKIEAAYQNLSVWKEAAVDLGGISLVSSHTRDPASRSAVPSMSPPLLINQL